MKVYPLPIYKERWRLEGTVHSLEQDMPRLREVFSKVGAALAGAGETTGKTRRLAYRCQKGVGQARAGGAQEDRLFRGTGGPAAGGAGGPHRGAGKDPGAGGGQSGARQGAGADAWRRTALVDEMLGHLRGVEAALNKPEVEVLVHLTVREKS